MMINVHSIPESGNTDPRRCVTVRAAVLFFAVSLVALYPDQHCVPQSRASAGRIARAPHAMVVTASPLATDIGVRVLRSGGNAVDAAVAVGFALAVTYPSAGNIGGGSFILIRMADGREAVIDARETAPAAARPDMFLDSAGRVIPGASLEGPLAAGVPGTVDGLLQALERYGTMTRAELIRPAVDLARKGWVLPLETVRLFERLRPSFERYPSSSRVFTRSGRPYRRGERFRQPDLACTLERIVRQGRDGFYRGETADLIVRQMREGGGVITHEDLASYRCIVRRPLHARWHGYDILTVPPPSAGGAAFLQALNILEAGEGNEEPIYGSARYIHLMAEALRFAFSDRWKFFGDPAFVDVPLDSLLSEETARRIRSRIRLDRTSPLLPVGGAGCIDGEKNQTTHYSIADKWGNAVAVTTTLNDVCGSKCVVEGAGFLLNNEMDDFSIRIGEPNQFGLAGSPCNVIRPGKRMVSSMTPVIVVKNDRPVFILGSPGGSRIVSTVLQVFRNVLEHGMALDSAVAAPRVHHQWRPDTLYYEEDSIPAEVADTLRAMGHALVPTRPFGRIDAVLYNGRARLYEGCSDPRGNGSAAGY
ncbi:MAG: gamma-glutamyltransferase [Bacteroidota bacterium]|nr:gamma-glutamyltransferase [Bacteroidota bacterium]